MYIKIVFKGQKKSFIYSYSGNDFEIIEGARVVVPLRRRYVIGYAIEEVYETEILFDKKKIKEVKEVLLPKINKELFELAKWISYYYFSPIGDVLSAIYPPFSKSDIKTVFLKGEFFDRAPIDLQIFWKKGFYNQKTLLNLGYDPKRLDLFVKEKILKKKIDIKDASFEYRKIVRLCGGEELSEKIGKRAKRQREIFFKLLELGGEADISEFEKVMQPLKKMVEKSIVKITTQKIEKDVSNKNKTTVSLNSLTEKQQEIFNKILKKTDMFSVHYIYGITGSGKTEIYFHLINETIKKGKSVLFLVPEISLTSHLIERFRNHFGDTINLQHSYMSDKKRIFNWLSIMNNKSTITLGARSAVFAPADNLGLIIVDEEHESSFKQNNSPTYNGRDVAIMRAKMNNIPIVLGSATPALESFYNAKRGKYFYYELEERFSDAILPEVKIVDMKDKNINLADRYPLSLPVIEELKKRIARKEQSILFVNRKGFNTYLECKKCGTILKCDHCDKALTYHKKEHLLKCHLCGKIYNYEEVQCKECGGKEFVRHGLGTEKVVEKIKEIFPAVSVQRVDGDLVRKFETVEKIFNRFKNGDIDILVGTQIIAKGINFPNVTFVSVLNPDTMINIPDFRANERSYQLISQVAGRAGRGNKKGKVLIQTYMPENYVIKAAVMHDYKKFYNFDIKEREKLEYPPITFLIKLSLENKNKNILIKDLKIVEKYLSHLNINYFGADYDMIFLKNDRYRGFVLFKEKNRLALHKSIKKLLSVIENEVASKIVIDVDPYNLF